MVESNAGYAESQVLLRDAASAFPQEVTRQWDNDVRFVTDPVSGERSAVITSRTATRAYFSAKAFLKDFEPAGKPGRPKGIQKPKRSGKAPLPDDEARAVFQAMEGDGKDGKDWKYCARNILKKTIPLDHRERERLRARIDRLKYKGSIL